MHKSDAPYANWMRYHSWKVLVGAILILVGLMNLYPFMWMMGTSLKSRSEATQIRQLPYPVMKYRMASVREDAIYATVSLSQFATLNQLQGQIRGEMRVISVQAYAEHAQITEDEALARLQALVYLKVLRTTDVPQYFEVLMLSDEERKALLEDVKQDDDRTEKGSLQENVAQVENMLKALHDITALPDMIEPYTPALPTITVDQYATNTAVEPQQALHEIEQLVGEGMLRRLDTDPGTPDAQATFEIVPRNVRQMLFLKAMYEEHVDNIENRDVYAQPRRYVREYATNFNVPDAQARKEIHELVELGTLVRSPIQLENYAIVLFDPDVRFDMRFFTSLILTIAVVYIVVLMTSMFGYAITRLKFPGRFLLLILLLIATIAPREGVIIPIFRMLQSIGSLDTLWGVVLWMGSVSIGNSLLMAGFFLTLPKEVEEAARVDGAGTFRTFFDIMLPMARPIVITVGLFAFLSAWNDFMIPLVCTMSRQELQPMAVAIFDFRTGRPGLWAQFNAAAAIMIIPVIMLFIVLQRYLIRSIAVGAVKG